MATILYGALQKNPVGRLNLTFNPGVRRCYCNYNVCFRGPVVEGNEQYWPSHILGICTGCGFWREVPYVDIRKIPKSDG